VTRESDIADGKGKLRHLQAAAVTRELFKMNNILILLAVFNPTDKYQLN